MRTAIVMLAAGIAGVLLFAGDPAAAKARPRVAGLDCAALAQRLGPASVWRAFFSGEQFSRRRWQTFATRDAVQSIA